MESNPQALRYRVPARFEDLWRVDIDCIEHVSAVGTLGNGGCLLGGNV